MTIAGGRRPDRSIPPKPPPPPSDRIDDPLYGHPDDPHSRNWQTQVPRDKSGGGRPSVPARSSRGFFRRRHHFRLRQHPARIGGAPAGPQSPASASSEQWVCFGTLVCFLLVGFSSIPRRLYVPAGRQGRFPAACTSCFVRSTCTPKRISPSWLSDKPRISNTTLVDSNNTSPAPLRLRDPSCPPAPACISQIQSRCHLPDGMHEVRSIPAPINPPHRLRLRRRLAIRSAGCFISSDCKLRGSTHDAVVKPVATHTLLRILPYSACAHGVFCPQPTPAVERPNGWHQTKHDENLNQRMT